MIRVRLNALSNKEYELKRYRKETLEGIFERVCAEYDVDESIRSYFEILLAGESIPREMWPYIKPKDHVSVLVALTPKGGGSTGGLLRQAAVIATVIAVSAATSGMGAWVSAGLTMAAATAATLLMNSLFPPPDPGIGGSGTGYGDSDSQMYSISSQSNAIKKYGAVPKVYGTHRMFPYLASNPYTSLEVGETGELVQYFYAIYDFGFGPIKVNDIKIGDTPIDNFSEAFVRLVDLNKPATDEGDWDEDLNPTFEFYKGDNEQETISTAINKNQTDSGVLPSEYEAIRNGSDGGNGDRQQSTITFQMPGGLYTFNTSGAKSPRSVEFEIQFAEVGTENWMSYNDEANVDSWTAAGDVTGDESKKIPLYIPSKSSSSRSYSLWTRLSANTITLNQFVSQLGRFPENWGIADQAVSYYKDIYGIKKDTDFFYSTRRINVDNTISFGGEIIGKIKERIEITPTQFKYILYTPFSKNIPLFTVYLEYKVIDNDPFPDTEEYYAYDINGKFLGLTSPTNVLLNDLESETTSGVFTIKGNSTKALFASVSFTPKTVNQIKIRLTRIRSYGGYTYRIFDNVTWATLATRFDRAPIVTKERHCFAELKVKATDQLNGTIRNLSAVCTSVLDYYDPIDSTWKKAETNNPAWVFADLLTGPINKNSLDKSRIETSSLVEWAEFCDEVPTPPPGSTYELPRFQSNFVLDYKTTLQTLLSQVGGAAQASLSVINGKYGVLIDKLQTTPVQVFTPRNSWGLSVQRTYSEQPDALKITYVDSTGAWDTKEIIVYADGFDENTAEIFGELGSFACTNNEQAWRYGRYMQAQGQLRQENISLQVDFESLICTRGDYVKIQHDVMKVGGSPARVKSVNTSNNQIVIDSEFFTEPAINYGYTVRRNDGVYTGTLNILDFETAEVIGVLPNVGDLLVWGEVGKITFDCLVKSIVPNSDLTAQLVLVEKADAIYDAESTSTLPDYDPQLSSTNLDDAETAPNEVGNLTVLENTWRCNAGSYLYYVQLAWEAPSVGIVETYEIYANSGNGYELFGFSSTNAFEYTVDEDNLGVEHSFKVLGVAAGGAKISLGEVTAVIATPELKTAPPSDVQTLYINILNETLQLDWDKVDDCDIDVYQIRYAPNLTALWEQSVQLQVVDASTNQISVQARTGTYFIKAIDWNGNESSVAARAITSIPELVNLNIIEETNDFPDLLGDKDQVSKFGDALTLQEKISTPGSVEYYSEGYYSFKNLLDLGEIYSVRLQSLIEAEGFTPNDLMVNWLTLSDVDYMSTVRTSEWNVETQYRSTDSLNVMADWNTMAEIDPISEGVQEQWTDWRKFTIGDFTGRIFQFRLKLISNKASVTPRVFDGIVRADMPDRIVSDNDLNAPVTGLSIVYDPYFAGPIPSPAIQITQDDAEQGDSYKITSKSRAGFTITFYDKNGVAVARQFDYMAKGYGRKANIIL